MNEKLKQIALEAGGSHYPSVGGELLQQFGRLVINECIDAVKSTGMQHAYTTYDVGVVEATIERSVARIQERFDL